MVYGPYAALFIAKFPEVKTTFMDRGQALVTAKYYFTLRLECYDSQELELCMIQGVLINKLGKMHESWNKGKMYGTISMIWWNAHDRIQDISILHYDRMT